MDYTKLFYWLVVADNAKNFFITFTILFTLISVIATFAYIINSNDQAEKSAMMSRKWMWWSIPFCILFWSLYIATPSKKDALLIVAGGQTLNFLASDESAKQIPAELSSFVLLELKQMASEAKVELGLSNQKERLIQEAKNMSSEELLKRMKVDTTFSNLLLK